MKRGKCNNKFPEKLWKLLGPMLRPMFSSCGEHDVTFAAADEGVDGKDGKCELAKTLARLDKNLHISSSLSLRDVQPVDLTAAVADVYARVNTSVDSKSSSDQGETKKKKQKVDVNVEVEDKMRTLTDGLEVALKNKMKNDLSMYMD